MAAGKNKLLRFTRLLYGGYDLSGDSRKIDSLDNDYEAVDFVGWSDAHHNFLAGWRSMGVKGYQAFINDAAAGAYTALLAGDAASSRLSVLFGSLAEPAYGDLAYLLGSSQIKLQANFDGGAGVLQADFMPDAAQLDSNAVNPLGVVLFNGALAATANGTSVDNLAASLLGMHANLHITVSSGGTWSFLIQGSTTDAWAGEETTTASFTLTGAAIGSEQIVAAGTIKEFQRLRAVRTSGTCTVVCTMARN